jgi:hypothetical protein
MNQEALPARFVESNGASPFTLRLSDHSLELWHPGHHCMRLSAAQGGWRTDGNALMPAFSVGGTRAFQSGGGPQFPGLWL